MRPERLRRAIHRLTVVLLALAGSAGGLPAIELTQSELTPGRTATRSSTVPLAPVQITQSVDPYTVVGGTSFGCAGAQSNDQHYYRVFDLDDEFGLVGEFCVSTVDYAMEFAAGPWPRTTVYVHCLDDGLPFLLHNLELMGSVVNAHGPADLEFFSVEVGGCCDSATQSMVVEVAGDDCYELPEYCSQSWIGCNDLGETGPTYLTAPDCGVAEPWDLSQSGIDSHVILVVHGEDESPERIGSTKPLFGFSSSTNSSSASDNMPLR